ncbi:Piso0_004836 [Millerozyma farinosa CBS 7064]|uniref:non-specific serine/threonine protein kinase n=1 Tax=Pichia sorbitophila (strain ATCC MYA-4447 / BCRC 22081 / CBS 7064 / NBRC 10061 / NRRL Y-12695) TaxID=559304 RepID=G8Y3I6_PICSO|nr:Piso0_004836 [Millerozyma farinosa CBS 7064]
MSLINKSMFRRTEVIGRGKFGVVYKGVNVNTKKVVAIKVLNLDTQEDEVADVQQEIQFLTEFKNVPNVTHYYGSFLNNTSLWIVMDYCAGGSIRTLLKSGTFEERFIGVILRELLCALQAVHSLGTIHRDLKAANVLVTNEGKVRLCDFGVATKITSNALKRTTMAGTPYWMAPEVIREGDTYNFKADIWSLGITLFEIATGNPPYSDKDASWAMQMISKSTPPRLEGREYSDGLKEAIALCLDEDPEERPSAEDLLKCKFVKAHKTQPTNILKELISKYLLWRDQNSNKSSGAYHAEEKILTHESSTTTEHSQDENKNLQVKWDFDSLSSREYIIENNIDINDDDYNRSATDMHDAVNDTLNIYPSFQNDTRDATYVMNSVNPSQNTSTFGDKKTPVSKIQTPSKTEIPKSLQLLFEDPDAPEENSEFPPPSADYGAGFNNGNHSMESPTIEIPDMNNISNFSNYKNSTSLSNLGANAPPTLNKPPNLFHTHSASGNLETRSAANRPRKKTISNTLCSIPGSSHDKGSVTPPTSNQSSLLRTPSPKPSTLGLSVSQSTNASSPSKSMKALQSNSNPLLQPINAQPVNTQSTSTQHSNNNIQTGNAKTSTESTLAQGNTSNGAPLQSHPPRSRNRNGLRIHMPTPANTTPNLSVLTNSFETSEQNSSVGDNVNQFGINPAQISSFSSSMTPVGEKDPFSYSQTNEDESSTVKELQASSKLPPSSMKAQTFTPSAAASYLQLPKGSTASSSQKGTSNIKFPQISSINPEYFSDSIPKHKLAQELEEMIQMFGQGLDALEECF